MHQILVWTWVRIPPTPQNALKQGVFFGADSIRMEPLRKLFLPADFPFFAPDIHKLF